MDNVYLYGERGLVNAILIDSADKAPNAILKQIVWTGDAPAFIDKVVRCEYLVEFSLGEFGSPDLIVIAYTDDAKYVIFTEAKVVEYKNAVTTKESYADAGCLNVQLALKWRFKEALKCNPKDYLRIVEVKLTPCGDKMRKLNKGRLVTYCRETLANAAGYYFVALTGDKYLERPPFDDDPVLSELIGETWYKERLNFGFLTYRKLIAAGIVDENEGAFALPSRLMLTEGDVNGESDIAYSKVRNLRGFNTEEWGERYLKVAEALCEIVPSLITVLDDCANVVREVEQLQGSYSYRVGNVTYAKIMFLQREQAVVMAILKDANLPQYDYDDEKKFICTIQNGKTEYVAYRFDNIDDVQRFTEKLEATFAPEE